MDEFQERVLMPILIGLITFMGVFAFLTLCTMIGLAVFSIGGA